ncbi:MAG TPA: hypothetical protein VFH68_20185 [Polyangia bacterium]|jgi:hypothetical protein|nr:hypothetical protein [Polyangia bacterium]
MNFHIADRAGFLAALAEDDPERVRAVEHTRACAPCRDAFAEGQGLVALLDESQPLAPPSPDLLARAAAAIERHTASEGGVTRRIIWGSVLGVFAAWAFQLTVGSGFTPDLEHAGASLLVLAVSLASVTLLRQSGKLAVALVIGTSLTMAWVAGTTEGLAAGIGVRCAFRELWAAGLTWIIVGATARRLDAGFGRWDLTVIVASGALAAHAGQHLACEVPHSHAHLLLFHFGAVLLAVTIVALTTTRRRRLPAAR